MKTDIVARKSAWLLAMALTLLLADACKDDDAAPAQASGCRLVETTTTASGRESETVTYTSVSKIGITHDDKGNETRTTVSYHYTYSNGTTSTYSGNTSKEYDDEGFLKRTVNQSTRTDPGTDTTLQSSDTQYTYENGRMIKSVSESQYDNGAKQTSTYAYEYDGAGNLIKFTSLSTNDVTRIEYIGKKVVKVTRVDAKGVETSPFFEYDSDGRLLQWIEKNGPYTEEYRYAYDSNGQVTRRERYIDGKTSSAEVTEYDTRESPYRDQTPRPKGHPTIPSLYAEWAVKNNIVRGTYYDGDAAGTGWTTRGSSATVYDYNAGGFPVSGATKNFDSNGAEIASSSAEYAYEGCR